MPHTENSGQDTSPAKGTNWSPPSVGQVALFQNQRTVYQFRSQSPIFSDQAESPTSQNKTIKPIRWTPTPMHLAAIRPAKKNPPNSRKFRARLAKTPSKNITIPILKYKLNSRKKRSHQCRVPANRPPLLQSRCRDSSDQASSISRCAPPALLIYFHLFQAILFLYPRSSTICYTTEFDSHFRAHVFVSPLWFCQKQVCVHFCWWIATADEKKMRRLVRWECVQQTFQRF